MDDCVLSEELVDGQRPMTTGAAGFVAFIYSAARATLMILFDLAFNAESCACYLCAR